MKIDASKIRKVREVSGAPMLRAKQVLEETKGDEKKAVEILKKEGFAKMQKRLDRQTGEGKVFHYIHHNQKIGVLLELLSETDFVAKNELFNDLGDLLALQIASMNPTDTDELLNQDYIKDPSKKIKNLLEEAITKTGENIRITRFVRYEISK